MSLFGKKKSAIRVHVFGKTDTGRQREHNEDSFLVADLSRGNASLKPEVRNHELGPKGSLLLVADGMGGAAAGEVASRMATETVYTHLKNTWLDDPDNTPQQFAYRLREAVEEANVKIHDHSQNNPDLRGMGTTATAVGILGDSLYMTQVGDSRAYIVRNAEAVQITKDQSLMQRLIDAGELTEEEAEKSERRNIILQALGPDPKVRVDLTHHEIRRGDAVVVCSDGLSGLVKREEIAEIVSRTPDMVTACGQLIDIANDRGGPDNITVIAARIDGDLKDPGHDIAEGYQVYPLVDSDSDTEPVPVYRGSPAPEPASERTRMLVGGIASALILIAALLIAA